MINNLNIRKIVYGSFGVGVVLYFVSAFLSPVDPESLTRYNISEVQLRLLSISILLPLVGIWACAAYGFVHFKQYALSIKGSPYGEGINTIANGLGIIALQLLVSGMLSVLSSIPAIETALGGDKGITIFSTNIAIVSAVVSSLLVYVGAGQLIASSSKRTYPRILTRSFYALSLISLAYLVSVVIKYRSGVAADTIFAYIPLSVAVTFIVIPHIFIWQLALLAVKRLYHYQAKVKDRVYRQAIGRLTTGFSLIVSSSLLIQLLNMFAEVFADLKLVPLLLIVYLLIAAIGVGYLFIARAAIHLRSIKS